MKLFLYSIIACSLITLFVFLALYVNNHDMGVLSPKGTIAYAEKDLLMTAVYLMMIVIIPVFVLLGLFLVRYRASNTQAKYTPNWHSNVALEATWWAIPAIIIIILGTITWKTTHELDPFKPLSGNLEPITIQVVALDWKWLFIYPKEKIATVNFIAFPKETPVVFEITADAPMNAFWIPQLGSQIYAMAGMSAKLNLIANETGFYKGMSSNYSGEGFSGMQFTAQATTQEEYTTWVNAVKLSSSTLTFDDYEKLRKKSKNNPITYYASVDENLYTKIIMKFMSHKETESQKQEKFPNVEKEIEETIHNH